MFEKPPAAHFEWLLVGVWKYIEPLLNLIGCNAHMLVFSSFLRER